MDENQARLVKARYQREWRAKNKDRVRAINQRYWQKRAEREAQESERTEGGGTHGD